MDLNGRDSGSILRVGFFSQSLGGGAFGRSFSGAAWGLHLNGIESLDAVYCAGDGANDFPPGTQIIDLGTGRAGLSIGALRRYLCRSKPDFLISGPVYINLVAIPAFLLARSCGYRGRLVISHHHPIQLAHAREMRNNKYLAKLLYRFASGSYGVSPAVVDETKEYCGLADKRLACIPNSIGAFQRVELPAVDAQFEEGKPTFVTASRLAPEKNIPLLIEAFAEFSRTRSARLLIIGRGPEEEHIRRLISSKGLGDRVSMLGYVDDPLQYMARADAFVLASDEEGFGQVLIEAMSTGCPVICTDARGGGVSYVSDNGRYAILVERGNREALANSMREIQDSGVAASYRQLSLRRAADFSLSVVGTQLSDFLRSLLQP